MVDFKYVGPLPNVEITRDGASFKAPPETFWLAYRGSIAHNMFVPTTDAKGIDDIDLMGFVFGSRENYFGLHEWGSRGTKEIKDGPFDVVLYEIRKAFALLLQGNPNILSMLWVAPEYTLIREPAAQEIIANRKLFLGKHVYNAFAGYAHQQMKKMETRDPAELRQYLAVTVEMKFRGIHPNHKGEQFAEPERSTGELKDVAFWDEERLRAQLAHYQRKGENLGYMGDKRKQLVLEHGYDCYDAASTEFLTEDGWKHYDDIPNSLRLLAVDQKTGISEWQPNIGRKDGFHSGPMYLLEPYSSRALVTPNHNLLVSPARRSKKNGFSAKYVHKTSDWGLQSVAEILKGRRSHFHVRRAPEKRTVDLPGISDSQLMLAGAYVSEGCTNYRKLASGGRRFKCIRITQKKPGGFFKMMKLVVDDLQLSSYVYPKETIWTLYGPTAELISKEFGHLSSQKHLPKWCFSLSYRQAMVIWNAMMLGDGTEKEANRTLYAKSRQLAADAQAMMVSAGVPCVVYGPYNTPTKWSADLKMYQVVISNTSDAFHDLNFGRFLPAGKKAMGKDGYPVKEVVVRNRRVVCFEVPSGTLVTRNGGKVAIHGNSKNAAHLIRLLRMAVEFFQTGEMLVKRPDREELLAIKRGTWSLGDVKDLAAELFRKAKVAKEAADMPDEPDYAGAEKLLVRLISDRISSSPLASAAPPPLHR